MIDLHIHSTFSDGTDTPEQILRQATDIGLKQISITDHNSIYGSLDALKYIKNYDIEFVVGCELSCSYNGKEVHLLGYFSPHNNSYDSLYEFIQQGENTKKDSQLKMIEKLNQYGFDISYDEIKNAFPNTIINRVHLSRILVDKGYVQSVKNAFDQYLGEGKPCYVERQCAHLLEGINVIHQCHGIAILAHPWQYVHENMEEFLQEALKSELDGIEVIHSDHSTSQQNELKFICQKYKKLMTGGSDYHGTVKPHIPLGNANVPDEYMILFDK